MKHVDWTCGNPCCRLTMTKTSDSHMGCHCQASRLRKLWNVNDLSIARRVDYKRFAIRGEKGYWEYVPHKHVGCLGRAPDHGMVVAKVACGFGLMYRRAMTFRPCKPPKGTK